MYIVGTIVWFLIGIWIGSRIKDNFRVGLVQTINMVDDEIDKDTLIECATWIQDNYSQNAKQGDFKKMLPKGTMRLDFTDDHYSMEQIVDDYINRMK
jgi:hypothetical protein